MWEIGKELWRQWNSRLTRDKLARRQPTKGHMRSTWWNLNNLLIGYISRVTSRLSQLASDPRNSLPGCFKVCLSLFLYRHYISPHYPRNCKEIVNPQSSIQFLLVFLYSYFSNYKLLRGSLPKHLPHPIWVLRDVLVRVESIGISH